MPVSEETYRRVALEDPEGKWELDCGFLRRKPAMTTEHNEIPRSLLAQLAQQLGLRDYTFGENVRLRVPDGRYYIPDVAVVPRAFVRRLRETPRTFEVYEEPVPLVVEVWSPSTSDYDVDQKLPVYRRRGDLEIWRIHPYERTLTRWARQPDGSYVETLHRGGTLQPVALPNVSINFAALFE